MEVKGLFSHLVCREGGFLHARFHIPHDQRLLVMRHHNVSLWRDDVNAQVAEMAAGKDIKKGPYSVKKKNQGKSLAKKWKNPFGATLFSVRKKKNFQHHDNYLLNPETENAELLSHAVFRLIRKTAVFFSTILPCQSQKQLQTRSRKTALTGHKKRCCKTDYG